MNMKPHLWEVKTTFCVSGQDELDASKNARELLEDIDAGDETIRKLMDGDIVAEAARTLAYMQKDHPDKNDEFYEIVIKALVQAYGAEFEEEDWEHIYGWIELQSGL